MVADSLRRLAERVSRNISFPSRLPKRFGRRKIYLSPANQLSVWKPGAAKFQTYLLDFADRFVGPETVVWDIGANMGMFALPAAHRAKFTLAIEPDPFNQLLLHKTRAANSDLALEVLPVAVSKQIGVSRFIIPERGRSANSLLETSFGTQIGGARQYLSVMTVTADWILDHFPAPDFVKIDAEGAELMILEGAPALLSKIRPAIVVEMPNEHARACAEIFRRNNYLLFSAYARVETKHALDDIKDVWDVLAIPKESLDHYELK